MWAVLIEGVRVTERGNELSGSAATASVQWVCTMVAALKKGTPAQSLAPHLNAGRQNRYFWPLTKQTGDFRSFHASWGPLLRKDTW